MQKDMNILSENLHQTLSENQELILEIVAASILPGLALISFCYMFMCIGDLYQKIDHCQEMIYELYEEVEDSTSEDSSDDGSEYIPDEQLERRDRLNCLENQVEKLSENFVKLVTLMQSPEREVK